MGLFDIFKKSAKPYKDASVNLIYELLFCDDLELYKNNSNQTDSYPLDVLFSDSPDNAKLDKIIADPHVESRIKILAFNKLRSSGEQIDGKELFGIIVEIGLENGLDVLASFKDGTARYINQTGKMIVWEATNDISYNLTNKLFDAGKTIIDKLGPWDKPRRANPEKGVARITFLVSNGLYFGEGPVNVLFSDPMAGPALASAAELMKFLVEKTL